MSRKSELVETAERAQTLMQAAAIFEEMLEAQGEMVEEGRLPDDDEAAEMESDMETAMQACKALSVSMTLALAQEGYVPDFADEGGDESDAFYGHGSAFM